LPTSCGRDLNDADLEGRFVDLEVGDERRVRVHAVGVALISLIVPGHFRRLLILDLEAPRGKLAAQGGGGRL
jgi:hypothetical protein